MKPENVFHHGGELQRLLAQRDELDKKIADMRKRNRDNAVKEALTLIAAFELSQGELFSARGKAPKKRPPKFRNPTTGEVWSGVGRAPLWYRQAEDKAVLAVTNH